MINISLGFFSDERVVNLSDGGKLLLIGLHTMVKPGDSFENSSVFKLGLILRPWDTAAVSKLWDELMFFKFIRGVPDRAGVFILHDLSTPFPPYKGRY